MATGGVFAVSVKLTPILGTLKLAAKTDEGSKFAERLASPTRAGVNARRTYLAFSSSTRAVAKGMTASRRTGVRAALFAKYSVKDASFISTPSSNTRIPIFDAV